MTCIDCHRHLDDEGSCPHCGWQPEPSTPDEALEAIASLREHLASSRTPRGARP